MAASVDIRQALEGHLTRLDGIPSVAWENVQFNPTEGSSWLKATVRPTSRIQHTIGEDCLVEHIGLFQVDVMTPMNAGPAAGETLAQGIVDLYSPGQQLIAGGVTLICRHAEPGPYRCIESWCHIPVTVEYVAYTPRWADTNIKPSVASLEISGEIPTT